jgi:hypothetical protein
MCRCAEGHLAGRADDLFYPVPDDVTHDLVRERRGGGEPDGPLDGWNAVSRSRTVSTIRELSAAIP